MPVNDRQNIALDDKLERDRKAEIAALDSFLDVLDDRDHLKIIQADPVAFQNMLTLAERRGYIHYTRLADAMGLKDASTVSRWFKGKVVPDRYRKTFAVRALKKIVAHDIKLMENGEEPIGRFSMKEHPDLGIDVIELVA